MFHRTLCFYFRKDWGIIVPERSRSKPEWQIKIAKERIGILFDEAAKTTKKDLQKRYMKLAKKIGMRYNVRLEERKKKFCKHCFYYFGSETRRRLKNGKLVIVCPGCKKITRYVYK